MFSLFRKTGVANTSAVSENHESPPTVESGVRPKPSNGGAVDTGDSEEENLDPGTGQDTATKNYEMVQVDVPFSSSGSLGLSIRQRNGSVANTGLFIEEVKTTSPSFGTGLLRAGDELRSIEARSLLGASLTTFGETVASVKRLSAANGQSLTSLKVSRALPNRVPRLASPFFCTTSLVNIFATLLCYYSYYRLN